IQTFTWWQYNDIYIQFNNWNTLPSVEMIDACHRNGVKVYSLIINPKADELPILLQKTGDTFPGADKMIEIAEYYGFDGWFINLEEQGTPELAETFRDFLIYFNQAGTPKGIRIMMYDSWNESGRVSFQNELNEQNDWYFHYQGEPAAQEFFLNYWYDKQDLLDSRDLALSYGRDPWDIHAGFETWKNYWSVGGDLAEPWAVADAPDTLSLSCFQMNGMIDVAQDADDFYSWGEKFYSGNNHDPSSTDTEHNWKGIAHYYPAKSVIDQIPFVTNFSVGNGYFFAVEGEKLKEREWNNRSIQDIPPSWRWIAESSGEKLIPQYDFTDAYYGGNSLNISGALTSDNLVKLYMTNLTLTNDSALLIAFKEISPGSSQNLKAALSFTDQPDTWIKLDVASSTTMSWTERTIDLSSYAGRTIGALGLFFDASNPDSDYSILAGRLGIIDGDKDTPSTPAGLVIEDKIEDTADI
ncbi:MAG: hypothetical protein MJB14_13135, partial [Spirochaetes bacterium]|nr:hypothetical protein [Spirochaetota bacterium]